MKSILVALLTLMLASSWANAQQTRPTHVVVIFDTTKSFWNKLFISHAVVERLLKELYFALPGHPDDRLTFISLNASPTIVTELSGFELRRKASRKFIDAFKQPDPRLGTDVVGAFELAALAFSRQQQSIKFLFIFSDMQVDPARTVDGFAIPFRQLTEFNWQSLNDVNLWIFFCSAQSELKLRNSIPTLQRAQFFSPPPMTNGVVEEQNLKAFINKVAVHFQRELVAGQLKSQQSPSGSFGLIGLFVIALTFIMLALLGLIVYLARRGGEVD